MSSKIISKKSSLFWLFENIFKISAEFEIKPDPKLCGQNNTHPCGFSGCEDMSCEDYCVKDKYCGDMKNRMAKTKKCCDCNLCENSEVVSIGKFTYFSIPIFWLCNSSEKIFPL